MMMRRFGGNPIFLAVSGVEGGRKEAGRKAGTGKEGRKEGSNFVTAAAAWFEPCSRLDGNMFSCAKELRQSVQTCCLCCPPNPCMSDTVQVVSKEQDDAHILLDFF